MKITVAIDSFKGSVTSSEAAAAVKEAAHSVSEDIEVYSAILADGGEGTVDAFISALGGRIYKEAVVGPLGELVTAEYGITDDGTAIIETASAAGLTLVPENKRDPLHLTTYGIGQLILKAIEKGARSFIIGLGGSATNDGGAGMISALGYRLLNGEGDPIRQGAIGLSELCSIDASSANPLLKECRFIAACDVKNPLLGEEGASFVYGPQKGADEHTVRLMDGWLSRLADITEEHFSVSHRSDAGAGAAGGLGFSLISYLNAELRSGIQLIAEAAELDRHIKNSDLVITGEGRLDAQSAMGKAPIGIAKIAKKHGKPVVALCGSVGKGAALCNERGIDAYFSVMQGPASLALAMDKQVATENIRASAEQAIRLFLSARK